MLINKVFKQMVLRTLQKALWLAARLDGAESCIQIWTSLEASLIAAKPVLLSLSLFRGHVTNHAAESSTDGIQETGKYHITMHYYNLT